MQPTKAPKTIAVQDSPDTSGGEIISPSVGNEVIQNNLTPQDLQSPATTVSAPLVQQGAIIPEAVLLEPSDQQKGNLPLEQSTANIPQNVTTPALVLPSKSKNRVVILIIIVVCALAVAVLAFFLFRKGPGLKTSSQSTPDQTVSLSNRPKNSKLGVLGVGTNSQLLVNADIVTSGSLYIKKGNFYGQFTSGDLSENRQYTLPDSSGVLCLDSNNCNFLQESDVITTSLGGVSGAILLGSGLSIQGTTLQNTQVQTTLNNLSGAISIQGTANQLDVTVNGNNITLSTSQDIAVSSRPTFAGVALTAVGTQNGNVLCDISNNCGYSGGSGTSFVQGGNSFGATATLGTNDNNSLVLETNNQSAITIAPGGAVTLQNAVDSLNAFRVNRAGGDALLTVVTSTIVPGVFFGNDTSPIPGILGFHDLTAGNNFVAGFVGANQYTASRAITIGDEAGTLCLQNSANCGFASGTGQAFVQNGNSFVATAVLGTNDNNSLAFETNGITRASITSSGDVNILNDLTVSSQLAVGSAATITANQALRVSEVFTGTTGSAHGLNTVATANPGAASTAVTYGIQGQATSQSGNINSITGLIGEHGRVDHAGSGVLAAGYGNYGYVASTSGNIGTAYGSVGQVDNASTTATYTTASGVVGNVNNNNTGAITTASGLTSVVQNLSTGSITTANGLIISIANNNASGTIGTINGINILNPTGSGVVTTNYGINVAAQTKGITDYGIAIGAADTQTLWLSSNADNTTAAAGIAFGSSRDTNLYRSVAGTLRTDTALSVGTTIALGTLGTTDTATHLCRNTSNQIAGCNTTGTGAAFVQGGNSFGAAATLGTNDSFALQFETGGTTQATLDTSGRLGLNTATFGTNNRLLVNPYTTVDNLATAQINTTATTNKGLVVQGIASQTANLQEWQSSTGTVLASVSSAGLVSGSAGAFGTTPASSGAVRIPNAGTIVSRNAANSGDITMLSTSSNVIVLGGSGQSGLQVGTPGGGTGSTNIVGATSVTIAKGASSTWIGAAPTTADALADTVIAATATTQKALVVQGKASQTANLQEWQSSAGTALAAVDSGGRFVATTLGAATNDTHLCRNSSNQIATCSGTGTGAAFVQGGNSFGAAAVLGTNDNNSLSINTGTGAINVGTDAFAKTITIGNSTGATSLTLNSGTGAINIGTNAIAHTITVGNSTGATAVSINCGTGNCNFGINATDHNTNIGGSTGASNLYLSSGTGAVNILPQGIIHAMFTGDSLILGTPSTSGTYSIYGGGVLSGTGYSLIIAGSASLGGSGGNVSIQGGSGSTTHGILNLGTTTTSAVNIGSGTGSLAVSVSCGTGTCGFGNNATDHSTTVGSLTGVSATTIQGGTGGVSIGTGGIANTIQIGTVNANIAQTVNIGNNIGGSSSTSINIGSGLGSSPISIQNGTGGLLIGTTNGVAQTIQIGANSNSAQTVRVGASTGGSSAVTAEIGSPNGTSSLKLSAGTGGINIGNDNAANTIQIGNANSVSAQTINIGNNIGGSPTTTINIGSGVGASTTSIQSGTGALDIGTNAVAKTITIGNATGATAVGVLCGTGSCGFGNNAVAHTTTIGSTTGAATTNVQGGTGGINLNIAGTNVVTIANTGLVTFQNTANNANAFNVNNTSSQSLLNVDTSGNQVFIGNGTAAGTAFNIRSNSTAALNVYNTLGGNVLVADGTNKTIGVGTTASTSVGLTVLGTGADATTVAQFNNAGGTTCTIQPGGTGFACSSDARLKSNVATVVNPLDTVKQLRGVTFNWSSNPTGQTQTGFIAQELEQLIPSAVSTDSNGYKVANYTSIIPYLVGAAQVQDLQITGLQQNQNSLQQTQTANNSALTNRVSSLEQKVAALEAAQPQGNNSNFSSLNVSGIATIQELNVVGSASIAHLTVTGDATFAGNITIQGHVLGNADTRGSITVPAGQTELKHTFVKPYTTGSQPNVILTPKNTFAPSYRVESTETDFTIYFQAPSARDVIMNYQVQE